MAPPLTVTSVVIKPLSSKIPILKFWVIALLACAAIVNAVELAEQLHFLQTLIDSLVSPIFYKDKNGVYQHCNDAFSKTILGIPKEEIIGKTLYDLSHVIPRMYADIYSQKDSELFVEPKEQFYEGKVKCSDGITRDYHFYKSSFVIDGEIFSLLLIARLYIDF